MKHREASILCCSECCFCWDVDALLTAEAEENEREATTSPEPDYDRDDDEREWNAGYDEGVRCLNKYLKNYTRYPLVRSL